MILKRSRKRRKIGLTLLIIIAITLEVPCGLLIGMFTFNPGAINAINISISNTSVILTDSADVTNLLFLSNI